MSSAKPNTEIRILKAAWTLMVETPGKEVRMSDIAKRAGISRQAVYLHFTTRAELLIATTRYIDKVAQIEDRLAASRQAASGLERLNAFIDAWGSHIPTIYPVARALLAMKDTDAAAAAAWADRMQAVREGCAAAVEALAKDKHLAVELTRKQATDILCMQLSVHNWQLLTQDYGWSQAQYINTMKRLSKAALSTCAT